MWRDSPRDELREYQLNTITYGLACAPFLAIRTLRQLAEDEKETAPLGSAILLTDVYMDDILTGEDTLPVAEAIRDQLVQICKAGGFPLQK